MFLIFLKLENFSCLQRIHIEAYDWAFDLRNIFEKLNPLLQLTSLTLIGDFSFSNEQFKFNEKINFFRFWVSQILIDLDRLLSCIDIFTNNGDFINIIKNTPNLIQLTTKETWRSPIQSIPFASELAYYLKVLKEHFHNEFLFEIIPNCFPIQQLTNDAELLKLVRPKSLEVPNYLNRIFPIDTYNSFVEQLFTIVMKNMLMISQLITRLMKIPFNLFDKLKFSIEKDIVSMQKLLLEGGNNCLIESTKFSADNFYKLFSDCFIKKVGINL